MEECLKCGNKWLPRIEEGKPKECPSCKNRRYWEVKSNVTERKKQQPRLDKKPEETKISTVRLEE